MPTKGGRSRCGRVPHIQQQVPSGWIVIKGRLQVDDDVKMSDENAAAQKTADDMELD